MQVKPKFHEDADKIEIVVPFEESIKLESRNPDWVKCPDYVLLTHNGRSFKYVFCVDLLDFMSCRMMEVNFLLSRRCCAVVAFDFCLHVCQEYP